MRLGQLLNNITTDNFDGDPELEIEGLAYDSRKVKPGYMFVAIRGYTQDGHDFVNKAIQNGAVAIIAETAEGVKCMDEGVTVIRVSNSRTALSRLAANFYGHPFEGINLIGITGTNGKTTTSYLLESILLAAGVSPGVIGTINDRIQGKTWEAQVTTPESLDLMHRLRNMAEAGVTDVIMEVSSHALDQGRVEGCPFRVAVFTNISRDHLDYHNSMSDYFEAKSRLFLDLRKKGPGDLTRSVINSDDPKGKALIKMTDAAVVTYGLGSDCDVRADRIQVGRDGLTARLITRDAKVDILSPLIGDFNIYNILAATATACCMDVDLDTVATGIRNVDVVPGRLELVRNSLSLCVIVDYAHTPDALNKALLAARQLVKGRLITVFGCGGDRDKGKRREMGYVAGEKSDLIIITSDNPRTEDPAVIVRQIEKGVRESGLDKLEEQTEELREPGYVIDIDRGNAIRRAVEIAGKDDLVLIAGKGHEDYQIIGKEKRYFDDRKTAEEVIRDFGIRKGITKQGNAGLWPVS